MSIEQALAENTAAIRELIEAIKNGVPTTTAQVEAVAAEAKAEKPKAEKKTEAPKPEPEAEESSAATQEQKDEPAAAEGITYEAVAAAITKLSRTKGRDAAVGVLAQFDAKKLPDVAPEKFAEVLAAAEEALA